MLPGASQGTGSHAEPGNRLTGNGIERDQHVKRKSKGRVKKFEETGKVLSFPEDRERAWDANTGEYE